MEHLFVGLGLISIVAALLNLPRFFEFSLRPSTEARLGLDLDLSPLRQSRLYLAINDGETRKRVIRFGMESRNGEQMPKDGLSKKFKINILSSRMKH